MKGRIHRTHGGALSVRGSALEDPRLREKEKLHREEKLEIAEEQCPRRESEYYRCRAG